MLKIKKIEKIPEHIAFIMDGNGRWATKRKLPRIKGHEEGIKRVEDIVLEAIKYNIKCVTFFAFSTENWKRPKEEVDYIFFLLKKFLKEKESLFKEKNIKLNFIGKINELDSKLVDLINYEVNNTKNNRGIILNIAINYGARSEIIEMIKQIAKECLDKKMKVEEIKEEVIDSRLMTSNLPKIDLLVRTSGEKRLSNFLLWQIAYSELLFTKTYWPDFGKKCLKKSLLEYQLRERRFGGLGKKVI